jgi:2-dehydro-3-deoxy-D-arabinonate dehydratase
MHLVRYAQRSGSSVRIGALEDGVVRPLPGVSGFADLLGHSLEEARELVERALAEQPDDLPSAIEDVRLLPPADGLMEVWAAGVTYERSMDARMEESAASEDVYARVYAADRPELFFKAPPWRVVTDGEPIGVRPDAEVTVPEPELALLVTAGGEVLGYTLCNDVSSRDIEGANPLYLPQAKIYDGSCSLAARVRPAWEVPDPEAIGIRLVVHRDGGTVLDDRTSTAHLHRSPSDLVQHLRRALTLPDGAVLATGTGVVPTLDFSLQPGDLVEISAEGIGRLVNPVVPSAEIGWLAAAVDDPLQRKELP